MFSDGKLNNMWTDEREWELGYSCVEEKLAE